MDKGRGRTSIAANATALAFTSLTPQRTPFVLRPAGFPCLGSMELGPCKMTLSIFRTTLANVDIEGWSVGHTLTMTRV